MGELDPRHEKDAGGEQAANANTSLTGGSQTEQEPARGRRLVSGDVMRRDPEIRADLDARLAKADDYDPNLVDLLVQDGVVVMLGEVPDYETKRRLEELAAGVTGVRELHDQLRVVGTEPSSTADGLRTEDPRADFRGSSR